MYELGINAAIEQWLSEELKDKYGIEYEYSSSAKLKLDRQTSIILFRSIKEILVNVIKHSRASKVNLRVKKKSDIIEVEIEDNGIGFDTSGIDLNYGEKRKGGFGLFSIREQIEYLGGKFEIESGKKIGTKAFMSLPINNQENAEVQK